MRINIRHEPYNDITIEAESDETVNDIIARALTFYHTPKRGAYLTKDDAILIGDRKLSESGIVDGDTLTLKRFRLPLLTRYVPRDKRASVPPYIRREFPRLVPRGLADKHMRELTISTIDAVDVSVGKTHGLLSTLKTKQIITETFLKFVPPSVFTTTMLLVGSIISNQGPTFLTAILVVIICMIISFAFGYFFQITLTNRIYDKEMELETLFLQRAEIIDRKKQSMEKENSSRT